MEGSGLYNAHLLGSTHLFGCRCPLCDCVCQALHSSLQKRPDLQGCGVVFNPFTPPVVPSNRSDSLLLCTVTAEKDHANLASVDVLLTKTCGPKISKVLRTWAQNTPGVRCRASVLGYATLEAPDATGCYRRGSTVRKSDHNDRIYHIVNTISTFVCIDELLPNGTKLCVFEGLTRGFASKSTAVTSKALLTHVQASIKRNCFTCLPGDIMWANGGAMVWQAQLCQTRLLLTGMSPDIEIAVPVTSDVRRAFDGLSDGDALMDAIGAVSGVIRLATPGQWNTLMGDRGGVPWKLALRICHSGS